MRAAALTAAAILLLTAPLAAQVNPAGRIVAVGDVHGDVDAFAAILHRAGLVDDGNRWIGGSATLVQTGDIMDRGPKVREVLDLLMSLEEQAEAAGGRVFAILGNHETMNMLGDLHDVSPVTYAAFANAESEKRRERAYEEYARLCRRRQAELASVPPVYQLPTKEAWMAAHPPGYIEYREALGPDGRYGKWLRSRPAVVQLGDIIFLHGGISAAMARQKPEALTRQVQRELKQFDSHHEYLVSRGVILPWFSIEETLQAVNAETKATLGAQQSGVDQPLLGGPVQLRHLRTLQDLLSFGGWSINSPDGPLWFRGYAMWSSEDGAREIQEIKRQLGVQRFVVGHTVLTTMRITPRFKGSVFLIDTGMLSSHYEGGRASALEIRDGRYSALYLTETELLMDQTAPAAPDFEGAAGAGVAGPQLVGGGTGR